jgi:hypothetical protein
MREFYFLCAQCGRAGRDPIYPEHPDDPQCEVCLPIRIRVNRREAAHVLERAMRALGRLP